MVKTYLRYRQSAVFGLIASPGGTISIDSTGQLAFAPQLEHVGVWNIRRGVQIATLSAPGEDAASRSEVTRTLASPRGRLVAVGYGDGMVRLFDYDKASLAVTLNGHRRAVSALCFSGDGTRLASGGRDTDVIVWDCVGEVGLARLRGHRDEVTDCAFVAGGGGSNRAGLLVTASKDTLLKVWHLGTLACIQTVVGVRSEVWSLLVLHSSEERGESARLLAGAADNQLRVWTVGGGEEGGIGVEGGGAAGPLLPLGAVQRATAERVAHVRAHPDGRHFAVQSAGKTVEVYVRREPPAVRRRTLRRLQRQREKLGKRARAAAAISAASGALPGLVGGEGGEGELFDGLEAGFAGTSLAELDAQILAITAAAEREEREGGGAGASAAAARAAAAAVIAGDEFALVGIAQAAHRITAFAFLLPQVGTGVSSGGAATLQLMLQLADNSIEVHALPLNLLQLGVGVEDAAVASIEDGGEDADAADADAAAVAGALASAGATTIVTAAGVTLPLACLSRTIALGGHRADVRAVAVSADGALLLSASTGEAKVWNARTGACLRTLALGDTTGLAVAFGPRSGGTRTGSAIAALVGCKDGSLKLFDLASGDLSESHAAHTSALWALAVRPDGRGCASGSSDKEVKFWDFDVQQPQQGGSSAPRASVTLVHTRTLKVGDEVLSLRYSHHGDSAALLLAVSLLDATVKVFFDDTLKFSLSLYGHKLPVLAMDVSADSTLLVTASSDKNVKLWGLDFGDCHKSFFAHADAVTGVAFVAATHYFFTCGRDRTLKYWDGDRFEHILTLDGYHKGEVWGLAAAPDGSFLVSASADRSLRVWRRTEEHVFLEEEREAEAEAGALARELRDPDGEALLAGEDAVGPVGAGGEAMPTAEGAEGRVVTAPLRGAAGGAGAELGMGGTSSSIVAHATRETQHSTDRLADALALAEAETRAWEEYAQDVASARATGGAADAAAVDPPSRTPELLGLTPGSYILKTLRGIPPSDLDQVLLVLPFSDARALLRYLALALARGAAVELAAKAVLTLVRIHAPQLGASSAHAALLSGLRASAQGGVRAAKDTAGYNLAGLRFLDRELEGVLSAQLQFGEVLSGTGGAARSRGGRTSSARGEDKGEKPKAEGFKRAFHASSVALEKKKDPYAALGIERDASKDDVKKAYYKLVKKYHPDLNKEDKNAAAKFHEVQSAYDILSDEAKKSAYDSYGHAGVDASEGGGGGGASGPGGGFDEFMNAEELFNRMFSEMGGGGGGRGGRSRAGPSRGGDIQAVVNISFMEAVTGCNKSVTAPVAAPCEPCSASGSADGKMPTPCSACRGTGQQVVQSGMMMMSTSCRKCGGAGAVLKNPCRSCGGSGTVRKSKTVAIVVPAGVDSGMNLRLSGEGDAGEFGGSAGHLFVRVNVAEDAFFKREGADVHVHVPLTFAQAALGANLPVPTVRGEAEVHVPAGTQPGDKVTLRGKGVRRLGGMPSSAGNQIVHFTVDVPRSLSARQKELLGQLAAEDEASGGAGGAAGVLGGGKAGGSGTFSTAWRSVLEATLSRVRRAVGDVSSGSSGSTGGGKS